MTTRPDSGPTRHRGSTLIELMVVVAMTGILAAMAIPSFQKAIEQAQVDQAALALRSVWTAQRLYKLDHGAYATDTTTTGLTALEMLIATGLLDNAVDTSAFTFHVGAQGFPIEARRRASGTWTGSLTIDEQGNIAGRIDRRETPGDLKHSVYPDFRFNDGQE